MVRKTLLRVNGTDFFRLPHSGWVISEEKFMKQVDFISFLKLRASYGLVGNDILNEYKRFLYLPDSYSASSGGYYWGVNTPQAYPGASELIFGKSGCYLGEGCQTKLRFGYESAGSAFEFLSGCIF